MALTEAETTAAMQRRRADDVEKRARDLHERLEEHQASSSFPADDKSHHHTKKASALFHTSGGVERMEERPTETPTVIPAVIP